MRDRHGIFGVLRPRNASFAAIIGAAFLVVAVASFVQLGFEQRHKNRLENILVGYLEKAQGEIRLWKDIRKRDVSGLVQDNSFEPYLSQLEPLRRNPDALRRADAQKELRQLLSDDIVARGYEGYFIISRDRINLASLRDSNIGKRNLLSDQVSFFDALDSGKPAVSRIVRSDVPLPDGLGKVVADLPTAFAGAPIKNADGKVVGYFTVRIPVSRNLSIALRSSQYGLTGETYAFDRNGVMITRSKFEPELIARGLLQLGQVSAATLELRNPGTDIMKDGFIPSKDADLPLTRMAQSATKGGSGIDLDGYRDYRGVEVVGAWRWIDDLGFGIASEFDKDEAFSAYYIAAWAVWGLALGAFLLFLIHTWITQRSAQQAVFREEKLRAIMESSADGIIVIDSRSQIEMINPAGASIFGYRPEDLMGEDVAVLIPKEDRKLHKRLVATSQIATAAEIRKDNGLYGQHRSGRRVPLEIDISPLELGDEKRFVGVVRDISGRLEADAERHKREQLLATVLQTSGAAVLFLDGNANITFANDTFEQWSVDGGGPSASFWIGQSYRKLMASSIRVSEGDPVEFERTLDGILSGELETAEAVYFVRDPEHRKWIKTFFRRIDGDDDVRCVVKHFDVSDVYRAEEKARLASEEAAAANNAKSLFLATMSHEIRTPMNSIIGLVDLLQDTAENDEQRSMLQTVGDSAQSLLMILNDILDFSKIDSETFSLETIPVNYTEILESVGELFSASANQSCVDILIDAAPDGTGWYYGDPTRLRQIVINLVGNAIKFSKGTDQRGVVILSTRLVTSDDGSFKVELAVEDNGIGIEKSKMEELFQPFVQADSSTTRRFGGTGLGLTITKELVKKMGGWISVESEVGVYTRFVVELPYLPAPIPQGAPVPPNLAGVSVCLIIQDDRVAEILSRTLRATGARVEHLRDASEIDRGFHADVVVLGASQDKEQALKAMEKVLGVAEARKTWIARITCNIHEKKGMVGPNEMVIGCHPIRPTEVADVCAIAAGRQSRGLVWEGATDERSAAIAAGDRSADHVSSKDPPLTILVAEDHPTNQEVLRRQLASLGYECKVVRNGREALNALEQSCDYGLLLTDCHMPVMDGFELTQIIRKAEARSGKNANPMPIIAITANALVGEAERCIDAGMNDYLSKPVKLSQLRRAIKRWARKRRAEEMAEATSAELVKASAEAGEGPFNLQRLSEIVGDDDPAFLSALIGDYCEIVRSDLQAIEQAIAAGDLADLKQQAHKAKGGARIAAAMQLARQFEDIENAAKRGDLTEAERLLPALRSEIDTIASWRTGRQAA